LQYELPFIDPTEPAKVLPADPTLWFATFDGRRVAAKTRLRHDATKQRRDSVHRLATIELVLKSLVGCRNVYLTQCLFRARVWRVPFFAAATHLWLDLDGLRGYRPYIAIAVIKRVCAHHRIPLPSVIVCSGRGYYAKWYLDQPLLASPAGNEAELIKTLNAALGDLFYQQQPDPNTHDAASLLRVIGSRNGKVRRGGTVRIVWHNGRAAPSGYSLAELCRALDVEPAGWQARPSGLYVPRGQPRAAYAPLDDPGGLPVAGGEVDWARLNHRRALDLVDVVTARWSGMVPDSMRDNFAHLMMASVAQFVAADRLPEAIETWVAPHLPAEYLDATGGEDCFKRHIAPVLHRAADAAEGKLVAHEGRAWTPIYTYRNARFIQVFAISPSEMQNLGLRTLIDQAEKDRREVINRRGSTRSPVRNCPRSRTIAIASSLSGTLCSLPAFMRCAGIVQIEELVFTNTTSDHRQPRASPLRAAVSIANRRHRDPMLSSAPSAAISAGASIHGSAARCTVLCTRPGLGNRWSR
jgi:hypothetical protein